MILGPTIIELERARQYMDTWWHPDRGGFGSTFHRYSDANARHLTLLATIAELLVARALGVPWRPVYGHDGGVDLRHPDGRTIQVKRNSYSWGDLYSRPDVPITADLHVLVVPHGRHDEVRIAGYLPRGEYLTLAQPTSYGHNVVLAVRQRLLRPFGELLVSRDAGSPATP